ncbi:hypothetical protein SZN_33536 [Streptomyces zinciresistens K42]|uniref:Integral membrane protein n=2 Tax=Streptomyces TaxID=1883 RepID=G2GMF5_9ACTN|nr:hypothetical protein SZN_33536 [Streptomyces zinciresistens K42]
MLRRERPDSPPDAPSGGQGGSGRDDGGKDDNPFAPPPKGTPDSPWRPRRRSSGEDGSRDSGEGGERSSWGGRWSDRQPGRSQGGFGDRQQPRGGQEGPDGGGPGQGLRWDPTDPAQRRARYALLCGMWAFFFALFGWPYVALMLGALALYWGITSLRAKPRTPDPDSSPAPRTGGRPQTTAAVSGLVTASLALVLVAGVFTAKLVYSDYYTCTNDALTSQAKQSCTTLLPEQLRGVLGTQN